MIHLLLAKKHEVHLSCKVTFQRECAFRTGEYKQQGQVQGAQRSCRYGYLLCRPEPQNEHRSQYIAQ